MGLNTFIVFEKTHYTLYTMRDNEVLGWIEFFHESKTTLSVSKMYIVPGERSSGLSYKMIDDFNSYFVNTNMNNTKVKIRVMNPIIKSLAKYAKDNEYFNDIDIELFDVSWLSNTTLLMEESLKVVHAIKVDTLVSKGIVKTIDII